MATLKLGHPNQQGYMGIDDVSLDPAAVTITAGLMANANYAWDTTNLVWIKSTGGGGVGTNVIVTNFPALQPVSVSTMPVSNGTWSYDSGVSGTVVVAAGKRVLQISASSSPSAAASLTVNGGSTITIPIGNSVTIEPRGALVAPTLVFTGTSAYFVEEVS